MTSPLTSLDLDEIEARAAALYEYATVTDTEGQDALTQLTDTDVPALLAEVRRLRAELAGARVQAIRDLADNADPLRPEISWFGDYGPQVATWMRKQAEYEQQRLAATGTPAQLPGGFKRTTAVTVDCAACGYHFDETEFIHAFDSVEEAVDTVVGAGWDELRDGRVICEDRDEKHEALRGEVGVVNDSDDA